MILNKFKPIIAQCYQGQQKLGVNIGGNYLYDKIFYNKVANSPIIINEKLFNTSDGYNQLYQQCLLNDFTLVLGGDHSIATSSVLASVNKYKNLSVIWIDAHADINTITESKTKNRHGTPLASCVGLENVWFNNNIATKLDTNKLYYVGIRDLDIFEQNIISKYNISIFNTNQMIDYINNTNDKIHISFDVDALDPSILDSTGTTAINGLNTIQVKSIISKTLELNKLIGLDIVEFNPILGNCNKSINAINEIFS